MVKQILISPKKILIERGNNSFEIFEKELIQFSATFFCKKCEHQWIPRNRDFEHPPLHCPKCHDKYWFLTHEELKKIKKKNIHTFESDKFAGEKREAKWEKTEKERRPARW